jgi:chromate transporter
VTQTEQGGIDLTQLQGYKELVIAMVRTGIVGYGGGPSIIPLIRYEAVTRYHWVEDEEFAEILAVANALPGPIATKMAAYLGYRRNRGMGAFVAILAHILPTCLAMVALLGALYVMRSSKVVKGMIAAVNPVVAVMLGVMAYEFAKKSWKGLGKGFAAVFGAVAFLLLIVLNISPAIVVAVFILYGAFHLRWVQKWKQRSRDSDKEVRG